jgi:argininosuccinate lyase
VGGWLHLGRSTHDLVAVAERIALRRRLLRLGAALVDLVETYADRAADTIDAVVPTYTGLRRAQVATIGFHLCAMATPHRRDLDRLVEAYDRLNRSPAGAAVGTTTDVDIDRHRTASLLGFDGVLANAEAVDKATDHAVEVTSVLSAVATNAGRAADSLLCWHSEEFGIVDLPDELCGTSSVMPQKRNPHAVEVVQRAADRVVGAGATRAVEARSAGPTLPPETADRAVDLVATLSAVVDRLTFDRDRAAALVADSWALATDLAAALAAEAGIAWRSAHQIVAVLVRRFEAVERSIHDLDTETLATTAREYLDRPVDLSGLDLDRIRDPRRALARRDGTRGSPAPSAVRRQIADLRRLASDRRTAFAARERALDRAAARRTAAVRRVLDDGTGVGSDQPSGGGTG